MGPLGIVVVRPLAPFVAGAPQEVLLLLLEGLLDEVANPEVGQARGQIGLAIHSFGQGAVYLFA